MGYRFYLWLAAIAFAVAAGFGLVLILFTRAVYAWGLFGAFLALAAVLLLVAWIYDRREARIRDNY